MPLTTLELANLANEGEFHRRVKMTLALKRNAELLALGVKPVYEDPDETEAAEITAWEATEKRITYYAKMYQSGGVRLLDEAYEEVFCWLQLNDKIGSEGEITDADITAAVNVIWERR